MLRERTSTLTTTCTYSSMYKQIIKILKNKRTKKRKNKKQKILEKRKYKSTYQINDRMKHVQNRRHLHSVLYSLRYLKFYDLYLCFAHQKDHSTEHTQNYDEGTYVPSLSKMKISANYGTDSGSGSGSGPGSGTVLGFGMGSGMRSERSQFYPHSSIPQYGLII